jgi:membrane-bound ClpP family serine protease
MKKEHLIRILGVFLILTGGILMIIEKYIVFAQIITFIGVLGGLLHAFKRDKKKYNEENKVKKTNFLFNLLAIIAISLVAMYSFVKYI